MLYYHMAIYNCQYNLLYEILVSRGLVKLHVIRYVKVIFSTFFKIPKLTEYWGSVFTCGEHSMLLSITSWYGKIAKQKAVSDWYKVFNVGTQGALACNF